MAVTDVATGHITYEDLVEAYDRIKRDYRVPRHYSAGAPFLPRAGAIGEPRRIIRSKPEKTPVKVPVKTPEPEKVPARTELT